MMGYFNAKVGDENTGYTSSMGRHGVGVMNGNWLDLVDFVPRTTLSLEGRYFHTRLFTKRNVYSLTSTLTTKSTTLISIGQKFRRSLLDVQVK